MNTSVVFDSTLSKVSRAIPELSWVLVLILWSLPLQGALPALLARFRSGRSEAKRTGA
jgi:hypothetical protein